MSRGNTSTGPRWFVLPGQAAAAASEALYGRAVETVKRTRRAAVQPLSTALGCEFPIAKRLIDRMEVEGVVSAPAGRGRREVLV